MTRFIPKWRSQLASNLIPLHLSYFGLNPPQQKAWNRFYRWLVPPKERWYFEGNRAMWGQLWQADRRVLYETVRCFKPRVVCEIGTWKGGGSTYFIAQALHDNGGGVLHTVELDADLHNEAVSNYRKYAPELLPHVQFHHGSSIDIYPEILAREGVDLVFLDGLGAEQTLSEFHMFEPYFKDGGSLIAHDWNDEKMRLLRPYIESLKAWQLHVVLSLPESVGLAVYLFRPDKVVGGR